MFPLNLLEELIKPVTLALRLFGNIFAGGIMLALIALMPFWIAWGPTVLWKAFAGAIAVIQAFIFALLTVLYFAMAGAGHDEEHEEHAEREESEERGTADEKRQERAPQPARQTLSADRPVGRHLEVIRGVRSRRTNGGEKFNGSRRFDRTGRCLHRRRHRPRWWRHRCRRR
jgi:hypothetical protein